MTSTEPTTPEVSMPTNDLPPIPEAQTPAMQTVINPLQPSSNASFQTVTPKKSNTGKIVGLLLLVLVICCFAVAIVIGIVSVKSMFVPYLSPVVEDLLNSPGVQLTQRLDSTVSMLQAAITTDPSNQAKLSSMEFESQLNMDYTLTSAPLMTDNSPILGIVTQPGKLESTSDITQMLSAKSGKIAIWSTGSYNFASATDLTSSLDTEISIKAADKEIGTKFQTYIEQNANTVNSYFNLNFFPANPYINTGSIENKWIKLPESLTSLTQMVATPTPAVTQDLLQEQTKTLNNLKKLFETAAFQSTVTKLPGEDINGTATKCYRISLDVDKAKALMHEWSKIDTTYIYDESNFVQTNDTTITVNIDLCFDQTGYNKKASVEIPISTSTGTFNISGYFTILSTNKALTLTKPATYTDYKDVDMNKIYEPMLKMYSDSSLLY